MVALGLSDDVRQVLDRLAAEGIPHMIVGGVALEALGVPRSTVDVDLQIELPEAPPTHASTFLDWVVEERTRDLVFHQDVLVVHRPLSGTPFELFLASHWLTRQALARRRLVMSRLVGREVPVPTSEDFILLKAAYMTSAARSRAKAAQDAVDIENVAKAFPTLQRDYVEANARKLGVWDAVAPLIE